MASQAKSREQNIGGTYLGKLKQDMAADEPEEIDGEDDHVAEMLTAQFKLVGIAPLLMQSDRTANPFDPITREIKKLTSKRKKTDEDMQEIAHLEFIAGLYCDEKLGIYIPALNIDAMLIRAAKLKKRGPDAKRGLRTVEDMVPLVFPGSIKDPEKLWSAKNGAFRDVRGVIVGGRAKVMRCRPIFREWSIEAVTISYDGAVFNEEDIIGLMTDSGRYIGLGTYRPRFGRFDATSL